MTTFDTPRPITARIEIASGVVHLAATDRSDTTVEVRPRDGSRSHDVTAADAVRVDFHDGTLTVTGKRGFAFPRRGAVAVDVELPQGSRLRVAVASADVTADGDYGDCTVDSASGDLAIGAVAGRLVANTASGDVSVGSLTGSAKVATASGGATIDDVAGDVRFQAASGALRVERLRGELKAQTASGDVVVTTAVRGTISAQTSSGEVMVGIVEGTAARLKLRTGSGAIRNDLDQCEGPADGDETLLVDAVTGSADVTVRRATPAAAVQS